MLLLLLQLVPLIERHVVQRFVEIQFERVKEKEKKKIAMNYTLWVRFHSQSNHGSCVSILFYYPSPMIPTATCTCFILLVSDPKYKTLFYLCSTFSMLLLISASDGKSIQAYCLYSFTHYYLYDTYQIHTYWKYSTTLSTTIVSYKETVISSANQFVSLEWAVLSL